MVRKHWIGLVVVTLAASACSGDDDAGDTTTAATEAEGTTTTTAGAAAPGDQALVDAATAWLPAEGGIDQAMLDSLEVTTVETAMGVSHVHFQQVIDGHPVRDAEVVVHVLEDGTVQGANNSLTQAQPAADATATLDEVAASDVAEKAVTGTVSGEPTAQQVWLQDGESLRLAWEVELATTEPAAAWRVTVDAVNGSVLEAVEVSSGAWRDAGLGAPWIGARAGRPKPSLAQATGDACELPEAPSACVFNPDPVIASDAALAEPTDANEFLEGVPLQGLADPSSGELVGEWVNANPDGSYVTPETDGTWGGGRGSRGFEEASAYYWVDFAQRELQRLGFEVRREPFPVYPIDPFEVDNAYYTPFEQAMHLGVGSNTVNAAEDGTVITHEYGHAVLDQQVPGLDDPESNAYHEAFGDIFAWLLTLDERSGDAVGCLSSWFATYPNCLRRIDEDKVYPADLVYEPHFDGEIYTGAIYDIVEALLAAQGVDILTGCRDTEACNEVRDRVLTTVLASHYYFAGSIALSDAAAAFMDVNEANYAGADADVIEGVFASHGLVGTAPEDAAVALEVDIAHSYRGDLYIEAGVVDPSFNPLCTPIVIAEPNEQDAATDFTGVFDVSTTDCAGLVPPTTEQQWYLFVEDTLAADEGELRNFTVWVEGTPFRGAGLPLPIADADPAGTSVFVDGQLTDMGQEGTETPGETPQGAPYVSLAITHTYVGDLSIRAGVADAAGTITCTVPVLEPDPNNSEDNVSGDVDMSACADLYPPSPDQQWYLQVIDTAEADEGTIDLFTLTGPDGAVYDFADMGVPIPDNDVNGVALLLDGSGGSSGTAGGTGAEPTMGLPAASLQITHTWSGDLAVTSGVIDASGNVVCEVALATPDPNNNTPDLILDASVEDCAEFYPPTPEQNWYLYVADTYQVDEGTVDFFSLTGPDGIVYTEPGLPIAIPDADPNGIILFIDGTETGGPQGDPFVSYVITHPYVGDLDVYTGVADLEGNILCEVQIAVADGTNNSVDLFGDIPVGDCAQYFPPTPEAAWFLQAIDTAAFDEGTIDAFVLTGPDGTVYNATNPPLPLPIPDEDPTGAATFIEGGGTAPPPAEGEAIVQYSITHPYVGDLDVSVGVADEANNILCEVVVASADPQNDSDNLVGEGPLSECAAYYPPTAETQWFIRAFDSGAGDVGTIDQFTIIGPDGAIYDSADVPVEIPDADPNGVALLVSG